MVSLTPEPMSATTRCSACTRTLRALCSAGIYSKMSDFSRRAGRARAEVSTMRDQLTPRERVRLALNHQEPDRKPINITFTSVPYEAAPRVRVA